MLCTLHEVRTFLGCLSPIALVLHAGKKASVSARVGKPDKAAPIKEASNDSKAGTVVTSKGATRSSKAEEAMPVKKARKRKKATAGAKAGATEPANTQAAPAAGKPRTPSRRTRKPSAVVVGQTGHTCKPSLCKQSTELHPVIANSSNDGNRLLHGNASAWMPCMCIVILETPARSCLSYM